MAYTVDTGSQKYYTQKNGLDEVKPIDGVFNSQSASYNVDTGSQKYYNNKNGLEEVKPMDTVFAVVAPAGGGTNSNFFMFFN